MSSLRNDLTRFMRFMKGETVHDDSERLKRLLIILGLASLVVILLCPIAVLAAHVTDGTGSRAKTMRTPTVTTGPSRHATTTPAPLPATDAPIKGLTDNPAYQWWERPHQPEPDSWWGADQTAQTLGAQISMMRELGVKLFRLELVWPFVAPTMPGGNVYNSTTARDPNWNGYQWSRWDMIVQLTAAAGIQLEPEVVYTPDWASGVTTTFTDGPNEHPLSTQYYGDFIYAAATRYKGQIHYWEMWNEPDLPPNTWKDAATHSLKTYVDFVLKPGYLAVKQVDPAAKVLLGGLAGGADMQLIYAAGGGPYFDIGNYHEYSPGAGGDAAGMDQARGAMNANGDNNKPLWLTEFGYKTQPDIYGASSANADGSTPDEEVQAQLVRGVYALKGLQAIFFYQLHDTDVVNASGVVVKQVHWGLVSRDLTHRKLAFDAYKQAVGGALPPLALASSDTNGTSQGAVALWYTSGPSPTEVAWRRIQPSGRQQMWSSISTPVHNHSHTRSLRLNGKLDCD